MHRDYGTQTGRFPLALEPIIAAQSGFSDSLPRARFDAGKPARAIHIRKNLINFHKINIGFYLDIREKGANFT